MGKKPSVILVNIRRLKDWYVATSEDLQGLHVADTDLGTVINEIPQCIKALFKAKHDMDVVVSEAATVDSEDVFPLRYETEAA